jgi:hypothetical protein
VLLAEAFVAEGRVSAAEGQLLHYRHELVKMVRAGATWQGGNPHQKLGYV